MTVKLLVRPEDIQKCDQILIEHHYLHSAKLVGEHLRYAVTWKGQWFAVATWNAAKSILAAVPPPASSKNASSTAMAALIACTRSSLASPPFPGVYQNEKVRPILTFRPIYESLHELEYDV